MIGNKMMRCGKKGKGRELPGLYLNVWRTASNQRV
jgi:hypothetical protein